MATILVARRAGRLEELRRSIEAAGGEATAVPADLASEPDRERVLARAEADCGAIDVLVNNAGLGWYGYARDMPWEVARQMLAVNVSAVAHLTLLALATMTTRGAGHIINVGSVAGNLGAQGVALYGGTKAFLAAFSRSLHREVRGSGVHVSLLQAGIVTETEFYSSIQAQPGALRIPAGRFGVPARTVADRIAGLVRRPRKVAYVPRIIAATTLVEPLFGWVLDAAGPLHLRRASHPSSR
jgi:short-subunit dehydrogenase